jgi:hypothetical protein
MLIKFLVNKTLGAGSDAVAYCAGDEHDIDDAVAATLIADEAAEIVNEPVAKRKTKVLEIETKDE